MESPYVEDPRWTPMLCKAMWVFFNCLGISVYCMLYEWALHLHSCSASDSLTSYIRGSTHVLITQTNLYKQQLFYLLILMLYIYVSRPSTIWIYLTVTYLCFHVSVTLCGYVYHIYVPSSAMFGSCLNYAYFISHLYKIYECWYHSCLARWGLCIGDGLDQVKITSGELTHGHSFY